MRLWVICHQRFGVFVSTSSWCRSKASSPTAPRSWQRISRISPELPRQSELHQRNPCPLHLSPLSHLSDTTIYDTSVCLYVCERVCFVILIVEFPQCRRHKITCLDKCGVTGVWLVALVCGQTMFVFVLCTSSECLSSSVVWLLTL